MTKNIRKPGLAFIHRCFLPFSSASQFVPSLTWLTLVDPSPEEVMAPALGASRLVHALLQAGAKPSSSNRNGKNGEVILPLHLATKSDDAQSVRLLSRSGADLNVTGFQWVYWVSTVSAVCLYIVMSCVSTQFAT